MVILSEARCRLTYAQLMPPPLTVSCFSKIQIGFTFLVPAHPGSPGKKAIERVCVCVRFDVSRPVQIMCAGCSPGKLRLPYDPTSPAIVCRTCHTRARRRYAHLLVDPGADAAAAAADAGKESSRRTPSGGRKWIDIGGGGGFTQHGTEEHV